MVLHCLEERAILLVNLREIRRIKDLFTIDDEVFVLPDAGVVLHRLPLSANQVLVEVGIDIG